MTVFDIPYQLGRRNQILRPFKLSHRQYLTIKRAFDLSICFLLMPILIIPMALIYLAILWDSPGSPIFVQERVGYGGRRFKMYKFRSMRRDFDSEKHRAFMQLFVSGQISDESDEAERAAKFKPIQQKDITRIGKLLRKTSLDELPQIFNIIKGDMSLIGPRPNVLWEVEAYKPWHYDRLNAIPGITGLAQVMGRSEISFDNIARYDIQYVKNQALHFDFWIIWQTLSAVTKGKGAG
jgi:lipopolysaccharide/colanic/teichoic acid biosynthesis glycosyltransferase